MISAIRDAQTANVERESTVPSESVETSASAEQPSSQNNVPMWHRAVRIIKYLDVTKSAEGVFEAGRAEMIKGVIIKSENARSRNELSAAMRSLTDEYSLDFYWWELIECLRKVLLTGLFVFYEKGSLSQLVIGLLICLSFIIAYHHCKPYLHASDNAFQQLCQLSIFITLLTGLTRYDEGHCGRRDCEEGETSTITVVLVVCALLPLAIILVQTAGELRLLEYTTRCCYHRCCLWLDKEAQVETPEVELIAHTVDPKTDSADHQRPTSPSQDGGIGSGVLDAAAVGGTGRAVLPSPPPRSDGEPTATVRFHFGGKRLSDRPASSKM